MGIIISIAIIILTIIYLLGRLYDSVEDVADTSDTLDVPYEVYPEPTPRPRQEWVKPLSTKVVDYHNYITSKRWHLSKARLETLLADNHSCRMCGSDECVEVHHITYSNLGNELAIDLVTLCRACHQITHDTAGKGAGHYPPIRKR